MGWELVKRIQVESGETFECYTDSASGAWQFRERPRVESVTLSLLVCLAIGVAITAVWVRV